MNEGGGTPLCIAGGRPHLLGKHRYNLLCGTGVGMTKEKQAVSLGASPWSVPAAAGILAELILVTISERIDLKSTPR